MPEDLEALTGEQRNRVYRLLRLEVQAREDGFEVSGVFFSRFLCTR